MGSESSHMEAEHAQFTADVLAFLPRAAASKHSAEKSSHNSAASAAAPTASAHAQQQQQQQQQQRGDFNPVEFNDITLQVIHHLVTSARRLIDEKGDDALHKHKELQILKHELVACSRFLASFADKLGKCGHLLKSPSHATDENDKRLVHVALIEGPHLAATALLAHSLVAEAVQVIRAAAVAQKRYYGGRDEAEMAASLRRNGALLWKMAESEKDLATDLQKAGALMHFRLLSSIGTAPAPAEAAPATGGIADEELASELNLVGKRLAGLGRFSEGLELEQSSLLIRRHILAKLLKQPQQQGGEQKPVSSSLDAAVAEAKVHLAFSLHDVGMTLVKQNAHPEQGIALLRECVALRRELAALDGGSNVHHRADDLAKGLQDLAAALTKACEGSGTTSAEAKSLLHESHVLYEKIVEKEREDAEKKKGAQHH